MPYKQNNMSNNFGSMNSPSWQDSIRIRTYKSSDDTLSQLLATGYFNEARNDYELEVGDVLFLLGSDDNAELCYITATLPDLTIDSFIGSSSIEDGAITSAKLADLAVITTKIASGAVTEAKLAADCVSGSKTKDYTLGTNEPYVPITQIMVIPAGPGGNFDKTFDSTGMVIDYALIKTVSAGTAGDTVQLFDALANPITEAFDTNIAAKKVRFFDEIDTLYNEVAAGSFIRATVVDGGGADTPELLITLYGYARP